MAIDPTAFDATRYRDRLARAQAEMECQGVDSLIVGSSSDLRYLTGYIGHTSERLSVLVLPRQGEAAYVVPRLEAPTLGPQRDLLTMCIWEESESPTTCVKRLVGKNTKHIAAGDQLWSVFLLRLQDELPGRTWISGGDVLRPLRVVKDRAEVELMREAARCTDAAWEEFRNQPLTGLTETQALQRLLDLTHARGLEPGFGSCGSGPNSASPHHETGDRLIQGGDSVVFDWGGRLAGYFSDVTRTVHVGEPGDEYRRVYDIVLQANQAALDVVQSGVELAHVDKAARDVIEAAGYGEAFIHRVGHGLGLDVHEDPYLVAGNKEPLLPGMVFSDEPGIYLADRFGIRIEDAVLCTETGGERLNVANRDLTIVS